MTECVVQTAHQQHQLHVYYYGFMMMLTSKEKNNESYTIFTSLSLIWDFDA